MDRYNLAGLNRNGLDPPNEVDCKSLPTADLVRLYIQPAIRPQENRPASLVLIIGDDAGVE